jgi:uncharacterized Tic20 family protein
VTFPPAPPPPGWQPPPGYGPPGYPPYAPPLEDPTLAVLVHLSIFMFGLIGPLVVYLVTKDDPYKQMTRHHAAEALNFHITLTLAAIASVVLILVIVGIFLLIAVFIGGAVLAIIAAVAAGRREPYRYPLTIRFVH